MSGRRGLSPQATAANVDIEALAKQVVPLVLAQLVALLSVPSKPDVYSTRKGHAPPGYADKSWKQVAPTIPGAVTRGRWIVVPRDDFEVWETNQARTTPQVAVPVKSQWSPAMAAAEIGLRVAGGIAR